MQQIADQENLDLVIDEAISLVVNDGKIVGIQLAQNYIQCQAVILTTGTYLQSVTHRGSVKKEEGADGSKRAVNLSSNLRELGFDLIRLKTGTPPRIQKDSIDYSVMQVEPGTNALLSFEHFNPVFLPYDQQLPCYIIHTTPLTHEIINNNLTKSAMYGGMICGIGPRYCPSIEDKLVKFPEKERHQIFVEPESLSLDTMYLGGFSTSMPTDIQEQMIRSLPGLRDCVISKFAYAIEYDAVDPTQIYPSLMTKKVNGLFTAGQINGTSGYEEAAGQGLVAGINAANYVAQEPMLILSRKESYIGVMIDDIVTKGVTEPYRLLTSRSEHRLYLRNDNADDRLLKYGHQQGLISEQQYQEYLKNKQLIAEVIKQLQNKTVGQVDELKFVVKKNNATLYEYLKRPEINLKDLLPYLNLETGLNEFLIQKIEIMVKFEGYIKLQEERLEQFSKGKDLDLSFIDDYKKVPNLPLEAVDKLNKIKPLTLSQAGRISGINLEDIVKIKYFLENQ